MGNAEPAAADSAAGPALPSHRRLEVVNDFMNDEGGAKRAANQRQPARKDERRRWRALVAAFDAP